MAKQPQPHWCKRDRVWRAAIGGIYTDRNGRTRRREISLRYPHGELIPQTDRAAALAVLEAVLKLFGDRPRLLAVLKAEREEMAESEEMEESEEMAEWETTPQIPPPQYPQPDPRLKPDEQWLDENERRSRLILCLAEIIANPSHQERSRLTAITALMRHDEQIRRLRSKEPAPKEERITAAQLAVIIDKATKAREEEREREIEKARADREARGEPSEPISWS